MITYQDMHVCNVVCKVRQDLLLMVAFGERKTFQNTSTMLAPRSPKGRDHHHPTHRYNNSKRTRFHGQQYLGVDDDESRKKLLPEALPQGPHLVEGAGGGGGSVCARLVGEVYPRLRNGVPADAPVPLHGHEEPLFVVAVVKDGQF